MRWSRHCGHVPKPGNSFTTVTVVSSTFRLATRNVWLKLESSPVGSVGDSYDNALAETIIGLYKAEVIYKDGPWRGVEQVEFKTLDWVDWFNNRRLFEPIGNIPPFEYEALYYQQQEALAMVAGLK